LAISSATTALEITNQPDALDVPDAKSYTVRPCSGYKGVEYVRFVGYISQIVPYPLLLLWPTTLQDICPGKFGEFSIGLASACGSIIDRFPAGTISNSLEPAKSSQQPATITLQPYSNRRMHLSSDHDTDDIWREA